MRGRLILVPLVGGMLLAGCGSSSPSAAPTTTTTSTPAVTYITPAQVPGDLGQVETVRFTPSYTYTDANGTEFLDQYQNYASGFVVTIYACATTGTV